MNAILLQCCTSAAKIVKCGCNFEAATNWQEVIITGIICAAFVTVFLYGIYRYFTNKEKIYNLQQTAETNKYEREVENSKRKQRGDLINKLLDFMQKQTEVRDEDKGNVIKIKPYNNSECKAYREIVCDLLSSIESETFDVDNLKRTLSPKENPQQSGQN